MKRVSGFLGLLAGTTALLTGGMASAQTVIHQWNFNPGSSVTTPAPFVGTGTASLLPVATPVTGSFAAGSSADVTGGTNNAWNTTNYPAQGAGNNTAGAQFVVPTTGFDQIQVSFEARASNTGSKYLRLMYTTDGTNYVDAPGQPFTYTVAANFQSGGFSADLSAIPGVNNNPNFKIRILATFDPATGTSYAPANATSTYGTTGTQRFDLVTIRGHALVPTNPTGQGSLNPVAICQGGIFDINCTVTNGQNPDSTGVNVTANLLPYGGSGTAGFADLGGGLWQLTGAGGGGTLGTFSTAGSQPVVCTVSDAQSRSSTFTVNIGVGNCNNPSSQGVVISQVYGGGGSTSATFSYDYVELFNRCTIAQSLTGYSLQYAAAGSNAYNAKMNLSGTIQPGHYYLVQVMADDPLATNPIVPTPDLVATSGAGGTGVLTMSNSSGRVSLVNGTTLLTAAYDPSIKDMAGYGTSAYFEGAGAAGQLSITSAALRKGSGCLDNNQNFNDFEVMAPSPRNHASPTNTSCPITCAAATCHGACVADFDDGTMTGTPDGGVTIDDLLYYLFIFDQGLLCADVDDGTGTGTTDGGVTIDDLLYYLLRFDAGC